MFTVATVSASERPPLDVRPARWHATLGTSVTQADPTTAPVAAPPYDLDELLPRVAAGDERAFEDFYDATCANVFGVALRVLRDRALASEVAQETYVEAWRTAASHDPSSGTADTWLLTTAHRRAVDRIRGLGSRDDDAGGDALARRSDVVRTDLATGLDVRRAFRGLTQLQREVLHLTYDDGLTYREAAQRLGRPLDTVRTRLRDGLRGLAAQLTA